MILEEKLTLRSSDGIHLLQGVALVPEGEVKGIFHVVHGMCEYMVRYRDFLNRMAKEGYLAFGFDQLGHGKSAGDRKNLGFIAETRGWEHLVEDAVLAADSIKSRFGDLPYYLFGHSMGSFVARLAAKKIKPSALLICGTSDQNPMAGAGEMLCRLVCARFGPRHISDFLQRLVFSSYDERFPGDYKGRWLTVDTANLLRYKDDPFCTFRFTSSAMRDLIALSRRCNSKRAISELPEEMPILLISGELDPVGGYGKGIRRLSRKLSKKKIKVQMHLYKGYRHEILNDFCREDVISDILNFLQEKKTP